MHCAKDFRRLRHLDKGKSRPVAGELAYLRKRALECLVPIKMCLQQAAARLGPPLRKRGSRGGWDQAAALLDSLSASAVAMEDNFSALTVSLEAQLNPSTSKETVSLLMQKRDEAKKEYEAAKKAMKAQAKACEERGLIPKAFPLI